MDGPQFASRHNHSLNKSEAKSASRQANAMLRSGVPEGIAIPTANKRINRLRKRGLVSDRARSRMNWGRDDDGIDAPTA